MQLELINERLTPFANDLELVKKKKKKLKNREEKQIQGGKGKGEWQL